MIVESQSVQTLADWIVDKCAPAGALDGLGGSIELRDQVVISAEEFVNCCGKFAFWALRSVGR